MRGVPFLVLLVLLAASPGSGADAIGSCGVVSVPSTAADVEASAAGPLATVAADLVGISASRAHVRVVSDHPAADATDLVVRLVSRSDSYVVEDETENTHAGTRRATCAVLDPPSSVWETFRIVEIHAIARSALSASLSLEIWAT